MNFLPFPVLTTPRLTLRKLSQTDAEGIFALRSDPNVIRYTGIRQYKTVSEATAYIKRIDRDLERKKSIVWSITLTNGKTFLGSICYWNFSENGCCAEIGYDLLPAYQGKGYMQEALKSVIHYGFHGMKLERITATPCKENKKSVSLLEKSGFRAEETALLIFDDAGRALETALYTLEKADAERVHSAE